MSQPGFQHTAIRVSNMPLPLHQLALGVRNSCVPTITTVCRILAHTCMLLTWPRHDTACVVATTVTAPARYGGSARQLTSALLHNWTRLCRRAVAAGGACGRSASFVCQAARTPCCCGGENSSISLGGGRLGKPFTAARYVTAGLTCRAALWSPGGAPVWAPASGRAVTCQQNEVVPSRALPCRAVPRPAEPAVPWLPVPRIQVAGNLLHPVDDRMTMPVDDPVDARRGAALR